MQRQQRAMTCFAFMRGQDSVALFIGSVSLQSLASVTVQIVEMFHLRIKMRKTWTTQLFFLIFENVCCFCESICMGSCIREGEM